ncbi:hypothetical protein [Enterococcus faecalis]|uniref:hypothetical protein n=1 Tax=Enterococcus faecalis TaxID=1351 RepID=UPI004042DD7C
MKNYWYVSLTHRYPQPKHSVDAVRVVMSVQIKKNVSIIEMTREATPQEIDYCKLVYCGHGRWKDNHVQKHLRKYTR